MLGGDALHAQKLQKGMKFAKRKLTDIHSEERRRVCTALLSLHTKFTYKCVCMCVWSGVLLDNTFFFQLFGVNPCDAFPALQTKDFAQRYMTACQVSLEFLDIYIKNLAVLVR